MSNLVYEKVTGMINVVISGVPININIAQVISASTYNNKTYIVFTKDGFNALRTTCEVLSDRTLPTNRLNDIVLTTAFGTTTLCQSSNSVIIETRPDDIDTHQIIE